MGHAITVGGLLLSLCVLIGIVMTAVGALAIFAGGMSDAPELGDSTSGQGCVMALVGIALVVGGVVGLVR